MSKELTKSQIRSELENMGLHAGMILAVENAKPRNPYALLHDDPDATAQFNRWDDAYLNVVFIANALSTVVPDLTRFTKNRWVPHARRFVLPFDPTLSNSYVFIDDKIGDHMASFDEMRERLPDVDAMRCTMQEHANAVALGSVTLLSANAER